MFGGITVEGCDGCKKAEDHFGRMWCSVYSNPAAWWKRKGGCPFMYKPEVLTVAKKRIGQQKQKRKH